MVLNYKNIQKEAENFAGKYQAKHSVPRLPDYSALKPFQDVCMKNYGQLYPLIREYLKDKNIWLEHGFEHLLNISAFAGFLAKKECNSKNLDSTATDKIVKTAILAGLMHDIDRHLGFGEVHMIVGEKTSRNLFAKIGIKNEKALVAIRHHDNPNFVSTDTEEMISYSAVFDADHLRYGTEREDTFWKMKEKLGVKPDEVIHDYKFLPPLRDAWLTNYAKKVGPELIDFGLAISRHIENKFTVRK